MVRGISKLLGFGAYSRQDAETWLASNVPSMHSTIDKGVRVTHHEYLGEMYSSTAYFLTSYAINPGLGRTFPWLCSLASAFQKWEDHGIVFYFKSTSSNALNSTNTALGSIMGAVTYNPYQSAPLDKISMLSLSGVQTGKPAEDNIFPVECKSSQSLFSTKLIRQGEVKDELAKYDAGNFHLATVGSQAAATIGELHVVYDITLKEPILAPFGYSAAYFNTTFSTAHPLGLNVSQPTGVDTVGISFVQLADGDSILFSPSTVTVGATYSVEISWRGTVAANCIYGNIVLQNLIGVNRLIGNSYIDAYPSSNTSNVRCLQRMLVRVIDPRLVSVVHIKNDYTLPGTPDEVRIMVHEVDNRL